MKGESGRKGELEGGRREKVGPGAMELTSSAIIPTSVPTTPTSTRSGRGRTARRGGKSSGSYGRGGEVL